LDCARCCRGNEGKPVSKQMVKWINGLKLESFVAVEATVQKPLEPVKSCKVSGYELHITRMYLVAAAPEMLGLGLGAASRAVGKLDEEETIETNVEGMLSSTIEPESPLITSRSKHL